MLKKVLKYDLKYVYKVLIIFYSLAIFCSMLTRLFLEVENSFIMEIIGEFFSGATIAMIANILINNMMRLWARFQKNLYGDESYLTHTLPVSKKTLYLSKFLSSLITLFTSVCIVGLTLFLAYYSKENIETLKNMIIPIANSLNSSMESVIISFLFIIFLQFVNIVQAGYTGLILGHKKNNAKLPFSILFGLLVYFGYQIITVGCLLFMALFNKDIMNLFFTNEVVNMSMLKDIIYISILIYTVIIIVGYFINRTLFKKGVNVD